MTAAIHNADCVEFMATMPDSCVEAVITDPPYGLSFMGKGWDHSVPGLAYWSEALRVSKPGAHLLCFGGTRTFHRMACAIEDAGWEIRDCIMWVYGSGFPKSLDVSKAIDKALGAERKVIGEHPNPAGNKAGGNSLNMSVVGMPEKAYITEPFTDQARQWQGWGTALKPAWEPIIVARKPLDGTVANTVLTWGTGALNIDACRVPTDEYIMTNGVSKEVQSRQGIYGRYGEKKTGQTNGQKLGRFPANLVHDGSDEVTALFPDNCGKQAAHGVGTYAPANTYTIGVKRDALAPLDEPGSDARFFYCAKASKDERGDGNDHPTVKPRALMEWLVKLVTTRDATVLDPFCGSGSTLVAAAGLGRGCIGIERDPHYCEIAERRLAMAEDEFAGTLFSLGMEGI